MEFALNHLREIDDSYLENLPVGFFLLIRNPTKPALIGVHRGRFK